MPLKTGKINALLSPLATVIEGEMSDGQLRGSYRGYAVEAWPHSGYPIKVVQSNPTGAVRPPDVHMLRLTLTGVAGTQVWHCQSSPGSYLQAFVANFTAGPLLKRFKPGEFKFGGVDLAQDIGEHWGGKLVERLGIPVRSNAAPALQERLIAAGLFDELNALRWGGHPYLPKIGFAPGVQELSEQVYGRPPALADTQLEKGSGRLQLDVEAGKAKVPSTDQFRELVERAVRIAEISAEVNQSAELP